MNKLNKWIKIHRLDLKVNISTIEAKEGLIMATKVMLIILTVKKFSIKKVVL